MSNKRIEDRIEAQRKEPVTYNSKGHITHIPDWAYSEM